MADTMLHLLTAQRRQAVGIIAVSSTAVFNVAVNFVVIPRYSLVGASAATAASELLCFALLFALFRRGVPSVGLARIAWRPLLAGAGFAGLLGMGARWLPAGATGTALAVIVGFSIYVALLVGVGAIGRADLRLLLELWPRRPAASVPTS